MNEKEKGVLKALLLDSLDGNGMHRHTTGCAWCAAVNLLGWPSHIIVDTTPKAVWSVINGQTYQETQADLKQIRQKWGAKA